MDVVKNEPVWENHAMGGARSSIVGDGSYIGNLMAAFWSASFSGYNNGFYEFKNSFDKETENPNFNGSYTFRYRIGYGVEGELHTENGQNVLPLAVSIWGHLDIKVGGNTERNSYRGVVDNTKDALDHYLNGKGESVRLGSNTIKHLLMNSDFLFRHNRIISGQTDRLNGNFSVNMIFDDFYVGKTNVNYSISFSLDSSSDYCTLTYTLFVNDGFYDPDNIDENLLGRLGKSSDKPDGLGPNLERFNGTPYMFIPIKVTYVFPNPGY